MALIMALLEPALAIEREHAVDALIRILTGAPDELELITHPLVIRRAAAGAEGVFAAHG